MQLSKILLLVAAVTLLASSNAVSVTANAEQTAISESSPVHLVEVGQNNVDPAKRSLRNVDSEDNQEERAAINFSALKKIIPGTAANKASKLAKQAAQKAQLAKGLDGMLDNSNNMYKTFAAWANKEVPPNAVLNTLKAAGRLTSKENAMVNQYAQYLKDLTKKAT